jgi:hypothetical protein
MNEETPNSQYIDDFAEDLRERYKYQKLCDWPLNKLQGEEWLVRNEFEQFKVGFPSEKSVLQGSYRQFVMDNPLDGKVSLTSQEKERIARLEKEIISNLNRAIGTKKEKRRKHRQELIKSIVLVPSALVSLLKELKSWLKP